jgi:hypothetical protein
MMRYFLLNDDRTIREVDDMMHWAESAGLVAGAERRNVGDDEIQGFRVSTKFIGIDTTPLGMNRPPRPFETMIFGPHGYTEIFGRWPSWDEAERMHAALMSCIRLIEMAREEVTPHLMDLAQRMARFESAHAALPKGKQ